MAAALQVRAPGDPEPYLQLGMYNEMIKNRHTLSRRKFHILSLHLESGRVNTAFFWVSRILVRTKFSSFSKECVSIKIIDLNRSKTSRKKKNYWSMRPFAKFFLFNTEIFFTQLDHGVQLCQKDKNYRNNSIIHF